MKKSLIPILSLFFIISLDSCKKDSDNQSDQGNTTRVVKISSKHSTSPMNEATYFEYDKSGRIISLKDSSDPTYYFTISYEGDEAIFKQSPAEPGNFNYTAHYKLSSDGLPVLRITAENADPLSQEFPAIQVHTDTCKFEYDAAGLLVKATGTGYDSTWSKYNTQISMNATRKAYTINYTNEDRKLMAVKITGTEASINRQVSPSGTNTFTNAVNTEENYSFGYSKNYANKVDSINAWVFAELDLLYGDQMPAIKYAYLPDLMNHSGKRTNVGTGNVSSYTDDPQTRVLEYLPSGYVASITFGEGQYWDTTWFTYNK